MTTKHLSLFRLIECYRANDFEQEVSGMMEKGWNLVGVPQVTYDSDEKTMVYNQAFTRSREAALKAQREET